MLKMQILKFINKNIIKIKSKLVKKNYVCTYNIHSIYLLQLFIKICLYFFKINSLNIYLNTIFCSSKTKIIGR